MALSWNEIKDRALGFSKEWADTSNEEADAKPFLVEFFNVFGISSKRVSTFEHRVKKLDEKDGYIDLLWKGNLLIEMKSRGKNLDLAYKQAIDYTHGLKEHELPKYVLISDFENFRLYDLENANKSGEEQDFISFKLNELVSNVQHFGYLLGYQKKLYKAQDPANIKAAELMGKLHDRLEDIGYTGHPLEVYLVRILFCLFSEDTTIFNKQQFQDFIEQRTHEDGSDLASRLQELFQVLNTPKENRFKNQDEQLADFPYVNGKLFEEILPTASFDTKMRQALLDCCQIEWSKISPAIFGSMFQSVMNPKERRNLGAHYTSETNILKLIKPLFLDELWQEFESIKGNKNKLPEFHKKLSTLKFLDPACGCGNFLVITYRELRLLELEILRNTYKGGQQVMDVREIIWLDVDMMYGIEYEEFPARIAEVAMWLIDHQMNMLISNEFGQYFARLPLKKSAKIVHGNAMRTDWDKVVSRNDLSCIFGNPPFIGERYQNETQRGELEFAFGEKVKLDYVAGWYLKAAQLIEGTKIKVGFVSTNSICQGEQISILWSKLFNKYNIKIHFAHQTFKWNNDAKGVAAVFCVIIGFANFDTMKKSLFKYEDIRGEAHELKVKNINPYLVDAKDIFIDKKSKPICKVPIMQRGSDANDKGYLLFTENEMAEFVLNEPLSKKYFKRVLGASEYLNNKIRYTLWLQEIDPSELRSMKLVTERVSEIKKFRPVNPHLYGSLRTPKHNFLFVPQMSSENRNYLPIGFLTNDFLPLGPHFFIDDADNFNFGVLTSKMHNVWIRTVCGRLKSDLRYSNSIVYNNYPWPENPTEKQIKNIEEKAQQVLDARLQFPKSSLADLYDPLTMPPVLVKAHNDLDKAVDQAYRSQPFTGDVNRMEFLFELYEKYTADLFSKEKKTRKKTKDKR